MRFTRYPRFQEKGVTPQRLAAARRRVARDKEECALFPELVKHNTPEERIAEQEEDRVQWRRKMRAHWADSWRQARRELRAMPASKQQSIIRYWNLGHLPGSPSYLLSIIHASKRGRCFWHALAEHRRLQLIGQGKLPNPLDRLITKPKIT